MKQLTVNIPAAKVISYPILIGKDFCNKNLSWAPKDYEKIIVITDHKVKKYYGTRFAKLLKTKGYNVSLLSFPAGEKYKSIKTKIKLEEQMLKLHCGRDTLILALGGGVVGDLAGFIAATYMRGIAYMQIPTTLLAMVDSSIGGKTGIDTAQGKNLIGAFWQPQAVIADINCLRTLPQKHLINGLIEALKVFLTNDAKSLTYFQNNIDRILDYDTTTLVSIVQRAAAIKSHIVSQDEKESNLRMVLNLGHTIGHALELVSQYKLLHGYAVAYGILVEAKIAELMGLLSTENYNRIAALLKKLHISGYMLKKWNINKIIAATALDKKARRGKINYVLLKNIGEVYQHDKRYAHAVPVKTVKKAFQDIIGGSPHVR